MARIVRRMVAFAAKRGHSAEALCRDAGVRHAALSDDEARIGPPPREVIERLLAVHGARGVRFSPPRG